MPIKDRLASLKKRTVIDDGEVQVMSSLISTMEQESADEFLLRASGLREAIAQMNNALELIRQLHKLLKVSTNNEDRARLRLLFDELSRMFKQFSEELDIVVAAVNGLYDEVRAMSDQKSAFYRMRKDQTESLRSLLHSVILRFRNEEVPFEQETKPATEEQLREFQMKPIADIALEQVQNQDDNNEPCDHSIGRGREIGDVEEAVNQSPPTAVTTDADSQSSLKFIEVDEEKGESDEKAVLMEVKQRNEDLQLLEKAVATLNSLHEHLNFLVHTQDPVLNRIDMNISQAVEYTEKVMQNTTKAVELSEDARQKSMLVFFLVAVFLIVFILMFITFFRVWVLGLG